MNKGDVFGIAESSNFARALANSEGIKVVRSNRNITPYSKEDGSIVVGTPSIYNHDEYMGNLHREIGKQTKDMSFFHTVDTEGNELQTLAKSILQSQRTEYHMVGEYKGRDRILREQYARNSREAGGFQKILDSIAMHNPTAAAMLYVGNEMRNDWQGFSPAECPQEAASEVKRLRGMLEEEWLQLDSEESLETLLNRIQYEEQQEQQQEQQGGGDGDSGEDSEQDEGTSEGQGEGSEGSGGSEGQGEEAGDPQSGDDEETGDGGESGETTPNPGEEDQSDGEGEGGESEGTGAEEQSKDLCGQTEGASDEVGGDAVSIAHNSVGATEASTMLKDIGLIKDPVQDSQHIESNYVPYKPKESDLRYIDYTQGRMECASRYTGEIDFHLGSFKLSRKIKKYLISLSQTGYQYGMKRGKICPKNISRVYAGHNQPRIFKQKLATKIRQDTAMFILGDCSGSMSNERYITSACCQIAMSEVLQSLHIAHMMMQFSTSGGRVHYIMKRFDEQFVSRDKLVGRYGSGSLRMGCNADGEAVTDAAQRLAMRPEKNKILVVLSDGQPAYGTGDDSQYLKDTVSSIEESKVMSIIGIGIQTDLVERFYKESKVVYKLDELESVLLGLLKEKVLA